MVRVTLPCAGVKTYSTAVDTWSCGCVMAELLSREPLFPGKNEMEQISLIFKTLGTPTEETWPGGCAGLGGGGGPHVGPVLRCAKLCCAVLCCAPLSCQAAAGSPRGLLGRGAAAGWDEAAPARALQACSQPLRSLCAPATYGAICDA